ncbi:MAG: DnaD domain protein [Longibaculum sp.]
MKLYMSDLYRVEIHYPLDEVQNDVLYYLYQPIIGSSALQLYMMLVVEGKRMNRFLKPSSLSRLTSFLTMSLLDMEKAFQTLEGIGLLKTFVKHNQELTQYVYQLQSPLSLRAFFKNQILSSLLRESLSVEDYQNTIQYFKISVENLQDYEDITVRFQDAFTISMPKRQGRILKLNDELKEAIHQDIKVTYDMDLLLKGLADYQVNKSRLSDDDMTFMIQLATVYSIDALTLAGMVKDAMESKGLNQGLLKSNIKKYFEMDHASKLQEVYHKQPLQYLTHSENQSPLVLHMKYLDSITPYELLRQKQGGKEPIFHDLKIVETLMVQLGLKPAVVNVLIEYVLGKNNNQLSKNYCETIGSTLSRNHIETAMDAYEALTNQNRKQDQDVEIKHVLEEETSEVNEERLFELLDQLEEGQL